VTAVCSGNPHTGCGKKDINVIPTGVDKPDACVCKGDKVEWHEDGQVFYHSHGESKGSKEWNSGTIFEYLS